MCIRAMFAGAIASLSLACAVSLAAIDTAVAQATPQTDTRPRLALIFGNADYNGDGTLFTTEEQSEADEMPRDLQKPLRDAAAMQRVLTLPQLGFQPFTRTERTRAEMLADLDSFSREIERNGPDALVIVYFSGHAIQVDGVTYLLPVEAVLDEPSVEGLARVAIPLSEILTRLKQPRNGVNLVIIDACRTDPWTEDMNAFVERTRAARATDVTVGQQSVVVQSVTRETLRGLDRTIIAWSTDDDATAGDGADDAPNSPYTEALLRFLPQQIELSALISGVTAEVVARTSVDPNPAFHQRPKNYGAPPPGICLAGCVRAAIGPAAAMTSVTFPACEEVHCPEMVRITGAPSRRLGASSDSDGVYFEPAEDRERYVDIRDFAIGKTEVTADQYAACVADNGACDPVPAAFAVRSGDRPVVGVTWSDAQKYVKWLSVQAGATYRLPSEAEWEYAARAGSEGAFPDGVTAASLCKIANHADNSQLDDRGRPANYRNQSCVESPATFGREPAPVKSFEANSFKLYDMLGNVWEWVEDCYSPRFEAYDTEPEGRTIYNPASCTTGVNRGGGWNSSLGGLRFADRGPQPRGRRSLEIGFRVARAM